jgi:predicted metal-dependent phosphoesterase TrpH
MPKIIFKEPDSKKLQSHGYSCIDMHVHSVYSSDSANSIQSILNKAKSKGLRVAITDHDEIQGSIEASKHVGFVIPGIEVTSRENFHILCYFYALSDLIRFYNKAIAKKKGEVPALDVIKHASRYKGIPVFAHPYRFFSFTSLHRKKSIIKRIAAAASGIEAINAKNAHWENAKALRLKAKFYTGGSDAHGIGELGSSITIAKARTVREFLDALKSGNAVVIGNEARMLTRVPSLIYYFKKKIFRRIS